MKRLAENYERYQREAAEMLKEGKHIGTFSAWQFEKQLVDIKIPMAREEHFRGQSGSKTQNRTANSPFFTHGICRCLQIGEMRVSPRAPLIFTSVSAACN